MSKKRFKLGVNEQYGAILDNDKIMRKDEIMELLNELHEENEKLKQTNQELYDKLQLTMSEKALKGGEISILKRENEQLKQREETLLCKIEDFQELLAKNDSVCHKRVIDLIDTRIKNGEEAIEWGKNMDANYGAIGFYIEMLKKIKKELQE